MPGRSRKPQPSTPPESIELTRAAFDRWRTARKNAKTWSDIEKNARAELERQIGDSPMATVNGVPVISWKVTEKRNVFDMDAFKRENPDLHASYIVKKDGTRPFNELEYDEDLLEDDE